MNILDDRRRILKGILCGPILLNSPLLFSKSENPYYIIVNADFSGHYKREGQEQYNGVLSALSKIKSIYPKLASIRVIKSDNKCRKESVEKSIKSSLNLINNKDRVLFVTGGSSSLVFEKQKAICNKLGILHLGGTCTTSKHIRQSFSLFPTLRDLNSNLLPLVNNSNTLVLSDLSNWGDMASKSFYKKIKLKNMSGHIFSNIDDFHHNMLKEKKFVYLGAYNHDTAKVINKILKYDSNIIILSPLLSLYNLESIHQKYHNNIVTNSIEFLGSDNISKEYVRSFGSLPTHVAKISYHQSIHALKNILPRIENNKSLIKLKNLPQSKSEVIKLKSLTLRNVIKQYENIS